jgi:single-stranded-DNA-specific exonuclease
VRSADAPPGAPLLERLLRLRGVAGGEDRELFLLPNPHLRLGSLLGDPLTLPDALQAARRVSAAMERGERVCVYGDYDVDGVTATAILVRGLRRLGLTVEYYIPHRVDEGFGLNEGAVRQLAEQGHSLIITVDCGSSDVEEIALARSLGVDVVVTDHHTVRPPLPDAVAVVNPGRPEGAYPFRGLTGAGLAYALLRAVAYVGGSAGAIDARSLVQLAALGTVADVAPLLGENRLLVRAGLFALNQAPIPGVATLLAAAGLTGGTITESDISFKLAPRLNAAGRMEHARLACDLLLLSDPAPAAVAAARLEELNRSRRDATDEMIALASGQVDRGAAMMGDVLTVYHEGWSPSLLGIVAGRLSRLHSTPVVAATLDGEWVRASARSVPGLDIAAALEGCSGLLKEHGGHTQAAGFTTTPRELPEVHQRLCDAFQGGKRPTALEVDAELLPQDISPGLSETLDLLSPFGQGNPEPLFGLPRARITGARAFGRGRDHLSLRIPAAEGYVEIVGFGQSHLLPALSGGGPTDLVVRPLRQRDGSFRPLRFALETFHPVR